MAYENASPDGTPTQQQILFQGQRAAGTTAIKTYANLANNQTLTLLENVAGAPTLVTFEMQMDGSFTPTGGAVVPIDLTAATDSAEANAGIVAFLNARPNAAYVFTPSASGYTFVAKQAGSAWNSLATGTAVDTSGTNAITTSGAAAVVDASDPSALASSFAAGGRLPEIIETWAPSVAASSKDFSIDPQQWRKLWLYMEDVGAAGADAPIELRPDGVSGGWGNGFYVQASTVLGLGALSVAQASGVKQFASGSGVKIELFKKTTGRWAFWGQSESKDASNILVNMYCGDIGSISAFLRIWSSVNVFRVGCRVTLEGVRS